LAKMEKSFVIKAAALLMLIQILSRLLGYGRNMALSNLFGQSHATDAFFAAFSIPDFIYNIIIGGAISAAFIPVFSYYLAKDQPNQAWRTGSIFSSWVLLLMVVFLVLGFIFTEPLMSLLTQFSQEQMALPVAMARITMAQALFMALSALATGVLQSQQHFTWPAIGVLLYNVFILTFGVLLIRPIEAIWPGYGVAAFSVGVVVGSIVTLAVQIPTLIKKGFHYRFSLDTRDEGFRQMIRLIIPVVIGLSVAQINMLVTQYLATGLESGYLTAMKNAYSLMQLPVGVFAASIAVAIFPTMTTQAAAGDYLELKRSISMGLRTSFYVTVPAAVGMILLREPIIRLLFEFSAEFTAADTQIVAQALLYYCIGLAAYGAIMIVLRGFYAIQNTLQPLLISAMAIALNVILSLALVGPLGHRGLALAYSLAGIDQCLLLVYFLRRKIGPMGLKDLGRTGLQLLLACSAMALAVWGSAELSAVVFGLAGKLGQLLQVGLSIAVGIVVYFVVTGWLRMEEFTLVRNLLKRRLHRKKVAASGE
jgi:putative peptidoglycan lipid II flippase